ncbi:nicotinate-nucleotide adenylyltransferase [Arenimonas sp. MALMAid1274]|uniref:nicotinate-nucleotide adenylyltransferase n=1 Tax=Arenimonas sp. MALMAid1274 TaxID=3411630 RepID=UPI003BA1C624
MSRVLYYGGTFDPVHAGHLAVAQAARDALQAQVHFLPAADPPHRAAPGASAVQRAEMLDLAVSGHPGFEVDRRELRRSTPSWTVDTLHELRLELGPDHPVVWLIGADAFRGLPSWHHWRDLPGLAHFVVAVRPGHDLSDLPEALQQACEGRWTGDAADLWTAPAGRVLVLEMPPHPASATEIRHRLRDGQPTGDWLAPGVAAFIAVHGLYRAGAG